MMCALEFYVNMMVCCKWGVWVVAGARAIWAKPRIFIHRLAAPRLPPGDNAGASRDIDLSRDGFWNGIKWNLGM